MKTRITINSELDEIIILDKLMELGIKFTDIHVNYSTFEEYMESILKRNNETIFDGHTVCFSFSTDFLKSKIYYFIDCWESGLSPYKALTFLVYE